MGVVAHPWLRTPAGPRYNHMGCPHVRALCAPVEVQYV